VTLRGWHGNLAVRGRLPGFPRCKGPPSVTRITNASMSAINAGIKVQEKSR
jgi:hypothetical protein